MLSNDSNKTALVLVSTVFNYSIKANNKTEDIYEVSCVLSSITDTIVAIWYHKENPLPDEYFQHLTSIYQTTSVEKFNQTFAKMEDDITYSHRLCKVTQSASVRNHPSPFSSSTATQITMDNTPEYYQFVLSFANKIYRELWHLETGTKLSAQMLTMRLPWSMTPLTQLVNKGAGTAGSLILKSSDALNQRIQPVLLQPEAVLPQETTGPGSQKQHFQYSQNF